MSPYNRTIQSHQWDLQLLFVLPQVLTILYLILLNSLTHRTTGECFQNDSNQMYFAMCFVEQILLPSIRQNSATLHLPGLASVSRQVTELADLPFSFSSSFLVLNYNINNTAVIRSFSSILATFRRNFTKHLYIYGFFLFKLILGHTCYFIFSNLSTKHIIIIIILPGLMSSPVLISSLQFVYA